MGEVTVYLDPNEIAFSYKKLSPTFSGCGRSLRQTLADILEGRTKAEDLPLIAVLALPSAAPSGENSSGGSKKRSKGGRKGKSKRGQEGDSDEEDQPSGTRGGASLKLPTSQLFRYFSMNNRRLWVLRQARAAGVISTIPCRLKPRDVCERLLAPVRSLHVYLCSWAAVD